MVKRVEREPKLSQKKSLGQVFLQEDWPCRKMVEQLVAWKVEQVIEIGPGLGVLTRLLLEAGINVLAVEKDGRFAERLSEAAKTFSYPGKLSVLNQDILKVDLAAWLKTPAGGVKAVCGNIPYNISSAILQWLLPSLQQLKGALLMVQWEFAQRVAATTNTKSYGSLSIFAQLRAKVKLEFKVARACFHPVPKVDSGVLSLLPLSQKEPEPVLRAVEQLTLKAFSQRRKMLSNSLSAFLDEATSKNFPLDLSRRCETVQPSEFILIAKYLKVVGAAESAKADGW